MGITNLLQTLKLILQKSNLIEYKDKTIGIHNYYLILRN